MTIQGMRTACWIPNLQIYNAGCVIVIGVSNTTMVAKKAPNCYVTRTLPVLLNY